VEGVEECGAVAEPTGGKTHGEEQGGKKGEENVERNGLGNHAALRIDPRENAIDGFDQVCPSFHVWTLYPWSEEFRKAVGDQNGGCAGNAFPLLFAWGSTGSFTARETNQFEGDVR